MPAGSTDIKQFKAGLYVEGLAEPLVTRIDRVSDRVDPETHTYEVRGPVDDPSRTAKAGSYLRAEVEMGSGAPAPTVDRLLETVERRHILRVLDREGGNKSAAARLLGVSRKTLERKCQSWGVHP